MSGMTLDGVACSAGSRVTLGAWGVWWADLALTEPYARAKGDRVTLVAGGVTCSGAVVSGGVEQSRAAYRICGGAGGWSRAIPAAAYSDDAGVKVATVLGDAARAAGETLDASTVPSTRLGPHYARAEGAASEALRVLYARAWHVGVDGVTRLGARASHAYTGDGTRTKRRPNEQVVEVATDDLAQLTPGVTIDGSDPATDVEWVLDGKRITARVWVGDARASDRRLDAFSRLLEALDPARRYRGVKEYRVVTQVGERLNLQPALIASGMPDLANVPVRPGVSGMRSTVQLGELVLVVFIDPDTNGPTRPAVFAHDAADAPGFLPIETDVGQAPFLGAARFADAVQAGPFAGTITEPSAPARRFKVGS